jgi:hypothetical protein
MDDCKPAIETQDNDFHEVWWNPIAGGDAPKGKLQVPMHEVWQWMGDAPQPHWRRPGDAHEYSATEVYVEGWRYVRPIALLDNLMRYDGEPPKIAMPRVYMLIRCPCCNSVHSWEHNESHPPGS